jgi:hypothetical protein
LIASSSVTSAWGYALHFGGAFRRFLVLVMTPISRLGGHGAGGAARAGPPPVMNGNVLQLHGGPFLGCFFSGFEGE